ncbi:MAG: hypothetical protein WAK06_02795, partial [Glutamicibacter protophormiae]
DNRGGGFKRNDDNRGGDFKRRDDNRGGDFKRNDDRGGFRGDNRGGDFKRRDDNRGGDFKRNDRDFKPRGEKKFEDPHAQEPKAHNPGDLRISNRADRSQSPEIDEDVTGKELDRVARAQLRYLEERSASWVAKHLVMAGRLLEEDPELAYEHTLAASRRGGRVAVVREAVGIAAYHAGKYADSLRELRTHRRISGSDYNLPLIADSLRGLGRVEKAIELAQSDESANLEPSVKVEMQIVLAGCFSDLGKLDEALAALESLEQLNFNRAFSFSPRLFAVYAELLAAAGRTEEAARWEKQVSVAERALGIEEETESFIIDLAPEMDEEEEEAPRARDLVDSEGAAESEAAAESDEAAELDAPSDELAQDEAGAEEETDISAEQNGVDEEDGLVEVDADHIFSEVSENSDEEAAK